MTDDEGYGVDEEKDEEMDETTEMSIESPTQKSRDDFIEWVEKNSNELDNPFEVI